MAPITMEEPMNPEEGDDCIYPGCPGEESVWDVGDGLVCMECGFPQEIETDNDTSTAT